METRPDFAELNPAAQQRVDDVCDAFEATWQSLLAQRAAAPTTGRPDSAQWPELDSYLSGLSDDERAAALQELVPIDVSYRRTCGAPLAIALYSRFPELSADWLAEIVLNPDSRTQRGTTNAHASDQKAATTSPPPITLETFIERLSGSRLLAPEVLDRERAALSDDQLTARALGERLVASGLLTPFQMTSVMRLARPVLRLGDYVILGPIGRGGMGAVYRARHRRMDRIVAIKVLPRAVARDAQAASRFSREIRAIAKLSHPHIVAAHDAGEDAGLTYLVMECIDGIDLASLVKRQGPLSPAQAVEYTLQAATGLEYAHAQGVIHRDVKPSNLIVCRTSDEGTARTTPVVKVLDLGLARFEAEPTRAAEATALTRTGMIFGTPEYMAPEQAVNASAVDARADLYSLGCTLFFLLTGRPVLAGTTFLETVMAHQLQSLPSLSGICRGIPTELEQVYRRMTARLPEDRYPSMTAAIAALRAIPAERLAHEALPQHSTTAEDGAQPRASIASGWLAPLQSDPTVVAADAAFSVVMPADVPRTPRRQRELRWGLWAMVGMFVAGGLWWWLGPDGESPAPRRPNVPTAVAPPALGFPAEATVVAQAQRDWASHLGAEPIETNGLGIRLCLIPPGEFLMGTPETEYATLPSLSIPAWELSLVEQERPAHRVRITRPFWMSETEVTVRQFRRFVEAATYITETERTEGWGIVNGQWALQPGFSWKDYGEGPVDDNLPASNLTWNDAVAFCEWLTRHETATAGKPVRYRLPTEAEWEYACRAGAATPWAFGSTINQLGEYAVYKENSGIRLPRVGSKRANPLQLRDMLGSQSEWCQDLFGPYTADPADDPSGPRTGSQRVQRGGNFGSNPLRLRSAARQPRDPRSAQDGAIRLVRE